MSATLIQGWSGAQQSAVMLANVFKAVSAADTSTEITVWTPAAGKRFRIMGFALAGASSGPYILNGAVLLQADDLTWHYVDLTVDGVDIVERVNQSAASAPGGSYLAYLPLLEPITAKTYRVALRLDNGDYTIDVDQTQYPASTTAATQLLKCTDTLNYAVSLRQDGTDITFDVDQLPT